MSFVCKACGRQRAGSPSEGEEVCAECRPTQMGQAALLLRHFEHYDHLSAPQHIDALDTILAAAVEPLPEEPDPDGSITQRRFDRLNRLSLAATEFHRAGIEFHAALDATIPKGHQEEW